MTPRGGEPLVLVADDDEEHLDLACMQLEDAGFQVARVHDGEAALRVARERHPDLCIFDVIMPRLRGHEVLQALRDDDQTAGIPVVLITATLSNRAFWRLGPHPDLFMRKSDILGIEEEVRALLDGSAAA